MSDLDTSTLRPGLLVSLKTTVSGNVSYVRRTIEADHTTKEGKRKASWETERVITDPKENERAKIARQTARTLIGRVCATSAFGLLCPDDKVDQLRDAIRDARKVADDFNAKAKLSRLGVYVITGRIARDDVEAVKAIKSEVRDLLDQMRQGVKDCDVKSIREAANKARNLGAMLSPQAAARVQDAIDKARSAARAIVKAGETAAQEVDQQTIKSLQRARTSFLDLDDEKKVAAPKAEARAVDLDPSDDNQKKPIRAKAAARPALEL